MPVEVIAGWLLMEAYKLIVVPVTDGVRKRIVERLSQKIEEPIARRLFGDDANGGQRRGDIADVRDADAGPTTDAEFVQTIEAAPEAQAVLQEDIGKILDVDLRSGEVRRGSDAWYVSAYAAIFWRIAMLAVWEERPIAIHGALQGREWVTVCVPKVHGVIAPSEMWQQWQQPDPRILRRVWQDMGPVDFFVRQIKDETARTDEVATLNKNFMIDPTAKFRPAEAESVADGWHRIDGVSRKWVQLKPDSAAEKAIRESRPGIPDVLRGGARYTGSLEVSPPMYAEYPPEWQQLLDIVSEREGIAALSAGADEFSRDSEASAQAVEAALDAPL
ncbi:hypothetical protein [Mycolicibacterium lutetiense]